MKSDKEIHNCKFLVSQLINNYKDIFNTCPKFEDLLIDCINLRGLTSTEFLVSSLEKGWLQNGGEEIDFAKIYDKHFGFDRLSLYEELETIEFRKYQEKQKTKNDNTIHFEGTLFDKYVWGILEEVYNEQQVLYGLITNVFKSGYEVTFNIEDIIFIPKNLHLEYPQIKGFVPEEKYKYFDTLTEEKFKDIKYYVKILFIEKSSKTLILKPSNYEL